MEWVTPLIFILLQIYTARSAVTPIIKLPNGRRFVTDESDGGYYRSVLVDNSNQNAYIGARNNIYKIDLSAKQGTSKATPKSNLERSPNFRVPETKVGTDYDPQSDVYKTLDNYLRKRQPIQLIATEKLSQVYKLKNHTYSEQCKRQVHILRLYYGNHLQVPIDDIDMLCSQHNQGLTWLKKGGGKLFSLRNGIFGTMPVGLTGVSDFKKSWPVWLRKSAALTLPDVDLSTFTQNLDAFNDLIYNANRTCKLCNYSQVRGKCIFPGVETRRNNLKAICYREYGIPNYMSTNYLCDSTPNPSRVITDISTMSVTKDNPLPATSKDSCPDTNLASTLLSSYHPDQATKTITSESGNGPRGRAAIYVLSEIGQEKQLDVNHEAFMGNEEPIPLTGSSSLSLVRLTVKGGDDVNHDDIVVSNPFKETWVTSPLSRYGRLVKTGNQATVPHRPRAVALFEDEDFIYFFFREVEWESMLQPEYSVNRYHFLWKSYDRTISYPWESPLSEKESFIKQFERAKPEMYMRYGKNTELRFADVKKIRNEHVYEPRLSAFKQGWDNSKLITRVGRVCKNDGGLPLGVQDASVFNLDNKLSLSAFQTFLKSKLTCTVRVGAVPRSWRLRKDLYSFLIEMLTSRRPDTCGQYNCLGNLQCSENYNVSGAPNRGVFCDRNLKGRDVSFRAFLDYTTRHFDYINPNGLFQQTVSGYSQYHWTYAKSFPTLSSVAYEYTELKDMYKIGDNIYGVFSSPHSESVSPHSPLPSGSAVCQFTMAEIRKAFDGPFKKRLNNAWRPYDPRVEGLPISPSPYSCDPDPVATEARNVDEMEIEFTDETLPLKDELQNFDMRHKSARLNFFEKDVEGSRTMWNGVTADPIYTNLNTQYEKILAEELSGTTLLYLVTATGEIHKVTTWQGTKDANCWKPNATELEKWWKEQTNLRNNSWGEDYFKLSQERDAKGRGRNYIFQSEWDCKKTTKYNLLAIYKPFGETKVKVWDMKLAGDQLVIGTDKEVRTVYTAQCDQYDHCSTCSRDPHCGWDSQARKCLAYKKGLVQGVKSPANCTACYARKVTFDPSDDIFLDNTLSLQPSVSQDQFKWYHNGSLVSERLGRFVLTRNNSLYIMNGRPEDAGDWELRDSTDNTCMVTHLLTLSECVTEKCRYEKQILNWRTEHDNWLKDMYSWQAKMVKSGCVNVGNS